MNLFALLLNIQGMKGFCERHLIADAAAPYGDISNIDLVWAHTYSAEPKEGLQQEMVYRLEMGLITAAEITMIKREYERKR